MTGWFKKLFTGKDDAPEPSVVTLDQAALFSFQEAGVDDEVIRLLKPEQAEVLRQRFLTGRFQRGIERAFALDPTLNSVTVMVGQYWCDEAHDAVQCELVWSELTTPDLDAAARLNEDTGADDVNLGGRGTWDILRGLDYRKGAHAAWESNTYCISLFAAYCMEGGHQEGEHLEFESPIAIYRRTGSDHVEIEFVGKLIRPWLDGVAFYYSAAGDFTYDLAAFEKYVDQPDKR